MKKKYVISSVAVFLLGMLATMSVTFVLPEQYSGSARVSVARKGGRPFAVDQEFVQAQLQLLISDQVLTQVIEKLNLKDKWAVDRERAGPAGPPETLRLLRRRLRARQVSKTAVLEVRALSQNREEAAAIANGWVVAYHDAVAAADKPVSISLLDPAEPALRPSFPNIPLCLAVGAMLSGLLSAGLWTGLGALAARRAKKPPSVAPPSP